MKTDNETKVSFYCGYQLIEFTWGCIRAIGSPGYVQMLVNPKEKSMALVPSRAGEKGAFELLQEEEAGSTGFAFDGRQLLSRFVKLMGWKKDGIYEISGSLVADNVLLFALDTAEAF